MIKLVLFNFPEKTMLEAEQVRLLDQTINTHHGIPTLTTEITHNGLTKFAGVERKDLLCWDADVYAHEVPPWRVRIPGLSREGISTAEMLMLLMIYENGTADAWVRQLLGDPDAEGLWAAYHDLPKHVYPAPGADHDDIGTRI